MNRIINNNKYKKIDWRMVGRVIVVILATFLINKFVLDIKNILNQLAIAIVITNVYLFYKIVKLEETDFSKLLKGTRAFDRTIKTNISSFVIGVFSFIYSFRPTLSSTELYALSKMLLIASSGFLIWLLIDVVQILYYNRKSAFEEGE